MSSRIWLNLALLVVVVALGLIYHFHPGKEPEKSLPLIVTDFRGDQITSIGITRRAQPSIVFKKQDGKWYMEAPYKVAANDDRVPFLYDIINAKNRSSLSAIGNKLEQFELDPPLATLMLNDQRFDFGGFTPLTTGKMPDPKSPQDRYIRRGDNIYVVADTQFQYLMTNSSDYVNLHPIDEAAKIEAISVPGLQVEQKDGKLSSPTPAPADVLARFVDTWRHAKASIVHAIDEEESLPKATGETVEIKLADGTALHFTIRQHTPELLLVREDQKLVYHLPDDLGKKLLSLDEPKKPDQAKQEQKPEQKPEQKK